MALSQFSGLVSGPLSSIRPLQRCFKRTQLRLQHRLALHLAVQFSCLLLVLASFTSLFRDAAALLPLPFTVAGLIGIAPTSSHKCLPGDFVQSFSCLLQRNQMKRMQQQAALKHHLPQICIGEISCIFHAD